MSNKGFTLVELLGVIIILGILGVIAFGTIDKNVKQGMYQTCISQERVLIEGAKAWAVDNTPSSTTSVFVSTLEEEGYIESDLKSPLTDSNYDSNTFVNITVSGSKYSYSVSYGNDEEKCENHKVE